MLENHNTPTGINAQMFRYVEHNIIEDNRNMIEDMKNGRCSMDNINVCASSSQPRVSCWYVPKVN